MSTINYPFSAVNAHYIGVDLARPGADRTIVHSIDFGSATMLLRSGNVRTNRGYTLVPRTKLSIRYTTQDGGTWCYADVWPDEYLRAIRTGRLGPMSFAALQIIYMRDTPGWVFDRVLQRLYYCPWRCSYSRPPAF